MALDGSDLPSPLPFLFRALRGHPFAAEDLQEVREVLSYFPESRIPALLWAVFGDHHALREATERRAPVCGGRRNCVHRLEAVAEEDAAALRFVRRFVRVASLMLLDMAH